LVASKPALYPLTFHPVYKEKIWGGRKFAQLFGRELPPEPIGESWDVAAHPNGMSVVDRGELQGMTLGEVLQAYGTDLVGGEEHLEKFPLLFKFIDAADDLSVQVHPDDAYAAAHEGDELGKTELWYVVHSEPGGAIIWGTKPGVTKADFARALEAGGEAVLDCLNRVEVKAGDIFPMSAGMVHALLKGVVVAEIQQNSDTTYRVYDWDRGRELHIEKALDVIDFSPESRSFNYQYARCAKYFELHVVTAPKAQAVDLEGSFHLLTAITEPVALAWAGGNLDLAPGQSCLIPACLSSYEVSSAGVCLLSHLP
jgi:mannose-6-phosphate isomerase